MYVEQAPHSYSSLHVNPAPDWSTFPGQLRAAAAAGQVSTIERHQLTKSCASAGCQLCCFQTSHKPASLAEERLRAKELSVNQRRGTSA